MIKILEPPGQTPAPRSFTAFEAMVRVAIMVLGVLCAASSATATPDEEATSGKEPQSAETQSKADLEERVRNLEEDIRVLLEERGNGRGDAAIPPRSDAATVLDTPPIAGSGRGEELTDSEFLKSVPLFGSAWRFSFGGYIKVDMIHDFSGTGDKQQFTLNTIPVNGSPQPGSYWNLQAAETRFNFEVRNMSPDVLRNRVFLEFDFFDESNPTSLRLRHAYFEYGNLLAGRTWTTLTELRQLPFLLDFAAGDSIYGGRTEQVRWQVDASDRFSWAVGLENYDDGAILNTESAEGTARSDLPRFVGRATFEFHQGVATIGGFVSQNRWDGTGSTPDARGLGWGVMTGGRIYIDTQRKNFLGFGASYSKGGPGDIISFAEAGIPNAVLGPDGELDEIAAWNIQLGLQVHWSEKWSSNLSIAYARLQPVPGLAGDAMRAAGAGHVNLIYTFNARLRIGAEYMYGIRELVSGDDGDASRLQFSIVFYY